jgi:hypothetical protein
MSITRGTVDTKYITATEFLAQREIDPNLYNVTNDYGFGDFMRLTGKRKAITTGQTTYHNWANQNLFENSIVSAVATTGASNIEFTVNTSINNPRQGDLWTSSNPAMIGKQGYVREIVYGTSTTTLKIFSVGGAAVPLTVAVGDVCAFNTTASSEKSNSPSSQKFSQFKYSNKIQKFRERDSETDVALIQGIEYTVNGQKYLVAGQHLQKRKKLEMKISYQMFAGVQSSTSFADAAPFLNDPLSENYGVQTTGGIDWYVTNYGIVDSAAVLGTFGFTEMDDICDNLIAVKAETSYMVICTDKAKRVTDKFLKNLGSANVSSVRMMVGGKEVDFTVDKVTYGKFTFEFVHIPLLDHPELFGSTRPDITGSLYFIPKTDVQVVGEGEKRADRMRIRYTPSPFMSTDSAFSDGVTKEWRNGALANPPIGENMSLDTYWHTEQGLEMIGAAQTMKYRII